MPATRIFFSSISGRDDEAIFEMAFARRFLCATATSAPRFRPIFDMMSPDHCRFSYAEKRHSKHFSIRCAEHFLQMIACRRRDIRGKANTILFLYRVFLSEEAILPFYQASRDYMRLILRSLRTAAAMARPTFIPYFMPKMAVPAEMKAGLACLFRLRQANYGSFQSPSCHISLACHAIPKHRRNADITRHIFHYARIRDELRRFADLLYFYAMSGYISLHTASHLYQHGRARLAGLSRDTPSYYGAMREELVAMPTRWRAAAPLLQCSQSARAAASGLAAEVGHSATPPKLGR